ncbi:condensation domain-containing protein [Kutzneria sp. CA-103260]|uniref:condensation domain-containing protein n=1 Tax=Kutzneria sp. CA-103260 TaxID=2802641 RepID=UPI001BA71CBB|nr:condensation domain-containing protein [Kutzneria sp. CA-103260]
MAPPEALDVTVQQRSLLTASTRLAAENRANTIAQYVEIHGPLDARALEAAAQHVIAQTDALRVRFVERDLVPRQEILPRLRWRLPVVDVSGASDPEAAAAEWADAEHRAPIRPGDSPLFSTALLRLGADHFRWYLRFLPMVMDAFSAGLLLHRVAEVYAAIRAGAEPGPNPFRPLKALHEELADYRASGQYAEDRAYWRRRLADAPAPVRLGSDRADAEATTGIGLQPPAPHRINAIAQAAGTAWPDLILAVVAAHVARERAAEVVTLTVPVSNRLTPLARSVPTYLANRYLLTVPVGPDTTFHHLLRRTAEDNRADVAHQRLPCEQVLADLGDRGTLYGGGDPSVNITPFHTELTLPGCTTAVHQHRRMGATGFDLFAAGAPDASGLRISLVMLAAPGDRHLVLAQEERLMRLLAWVVDHPNRPLREAGTP